MPANDPTRPAPAPLGRRVLQTFFSPAELFRSFGELPPWVGPLAVSVVVGMLVVLAVPDRVFVEGMEGAVNRRGRPVEITSDPETIARWGRLLRMLSALAAQPVLAFAAAGVLMLLFSVLLRGEARYPQYLAITTHAFLITALGSLLAAGIGVLRGAEPQGITPALLPALAPDTVADRILGGIDLFTVWALVFAALGVSMVNRRRSWASAAALLLALYLAAAVALGVAAA